MLARAGTFLIAAVLAGLLGWSGALGAAESVAQFLFVVFLLLFLVTLIFGRIRIPP
jgi:uncharacterized membrane protein YtjA (UPF0391 family)